jgi:Na+-driven multidrug efflux pump
MVVVPDLILGAFIADDPGAIEVARLPLRLVGAVLVVDSVGLVLLNALLGAGASSMVMRISISMQWFMFLPLAWYIGPRAGYGLLGIWICNGVYRALQSVVFAVQWRRGTWKSIKV